MIIKIIDSLIKKSSNSFFRRCLACYNHKVINMPKNDQIISNNFNIEDEMDKDKLIYLIKNIQIINLKDKNILNNISNLLKKYINDYNIEEIYLIIHSFCKLNFTKHSLYTNFVKIIMNKKPLMNTRMLTQILIDLHKLSSLDINVLTFFTEHYIKGSINKFSLFDLSMILFIYNKYNYNDFITINTICEIIKEYFLPIINEDKGVLTTILLSISTLNLNYEIYYYLLKKYIYKNYEHFEIKYLCNISYSIVLRLANNSIKDDLLNIILNDIITLLLNNLHKLKNEELKQIHIVLYYLRDEKEKYENAIKKIEKKNIKNTVTISKMQQQIEKIFKEIGIYVQKEYKIGPYILDFALKKKKICIEVNGFTHYYIFTSTLNAKTKLKYFILNKLNWNVVTIEYMDWKNKSKE
ncbi:RAP protein, putative, partial [Plasmodium gallinaceum]